MATGSQIWTALYIESNRVLLTYDGRIELNHVELFTISLPEEFLKERGKRAIDVTLTFDPPTNGNSADYLAEYQRKPRINTGEPLVLAVVCQKKWFDEQNCKQPYSVAVTFGHSHEIDLYNMIRLKNKAMARVR